LLLAIAALIMKNPSESEQIGVSTSPAPAGFIDKKHGPLAGFITL